MNHELIAYNPKIATRFRGYYPVIVDVETGGINAGTDALLEIAAVTVNCDEFGVFQPAETFHHHINPFPGANLDPNSMAIHNIDPEHPFRFAVSEEIALKEIFAALQKIQKQAGCNKCVLVGHNAWFDLGFVNAAANRAKIKKNPFHSFTCFDTATLGAVTYGHTVLSESLKRAAIPFEAGSQHSAIYDAEQTAHLFCKIINLAPWPTV